MNNPMPRLALGTSQLKGDACRASVAAALSLGYHGIDTAQMYGNEAEIGATLAAQKARAKVFLTTKISMPNVLAGNVVASAEQSLQALQTDAVDLLLLHRPPEKAEQLAALWADMEKLHAQGKARHLGVSNFNTAMLQALFKVAKIKPITNQVEYHPLLGQNAVLTFCRAHAMTLTAYCPLGRGAVFGNPVLESIAQKHNRTVAQVALRWLLDQEGVVAIPRSSNPQRLAENLELDFKLAPDDTAAIDALPKTHRVFPFAWGNWDA